jgi:hypothetical protein
MKKYVIMFIIFMLVCPSLSTKIIYGAESNEVLSAKVEAIEKMLIDLREQLKQQAETNKTEQKEELQALIRDEVRGLVPGEDYWTEKAQELGEKGPIDKFNFGLLIESGVVDRDQNANGEDENDISLTTVSLSIEAIVNKWVTGETNFLYEDPGFNDDDASLDVEEGFLTIGNSDEFPFYAKVGNFYVPYGAVLTHFPDYPLIDSSVTRTFGELNERALLAGFEKWGLSLSAYVFNGAVEKTADDADAIDSFGFDANYTYESEPNELTLQVGASYLSNLADTNGISGVVPGTLERLVDGWAAYLSSSWGKFFLDAEYMGALDEFRVAELAEDSRGAEPSVWNIEFGLNHDWWRNLEVAFKIAGSDEAENLSIPGTRFGVVLNQEIFDNTIWSAGYLSDDFEKDIFDNSTEDQRSTLFTQIAIEL